MRYTLASMATNTQDVRLPVEPDPTTGKNTSPKFDIGRAFAVKLWNASRFVLMQLEQANSHRGTETQSEKIDELKWTMADRWIVSRFNRAVGEATEALSSYRFDQYAKSVYDFFWRDFCDWYVEFAKPQMRSDAHKAQTAQILASVLDGALRLLHPVIPHVTEVLWWKLNDIAPHRGLPGRIECADPRISTRAKRLITAPFPTDSKNYSDAAEHIFPKIQDIITTIRNVRNDYKVDAKKPVTVHIMAPGDSGRQITALQPAIEMMATCKLAAVGPDISAPAGAVRATCDKCELYIEGLIDQAADAARVSKLRDELSKKIATLKGRLSNEGYIARAPEKLVQETKDQLAAAEAELAKLS
jgi:valyl-tRNA synthetase